MKSALLRCEIGERRGDPLRRNGADAEFVAAAARILQEGVSGDRHQG